LIKDFFGKDNMDDEIMEVYQMLDAMIEIEGDVRYFLCGLDIEQSEAVDTSTEESCWDLTQQLLQKLDEHYSELIEISEVQNGYITEEEEPFMDDYEDEVIPAREKFYSIAKDGAQEMYEAMQGMLADLNVESTDPNDKSDHDNVDISSSNHSNPSKPEEQSHTEPEDVQNVHNIHNDELLISLEVHQRSGSNQTTDSMATMIQHNRTNSVKSTNTHYTQYSGYTQYTQSPKKRIPLTSNYSGHSVSNLDDHREHSSGHSRHDFEHDSVSGSTISAATVTTGTTAHKSPNMKVQFAPPSVDTTSKPDPNLMITQSGKSVSTRSGFDVVSTDGGANCTFIFGDLCAVVPVVTVAALIVDPLTESCSKSCLLWPLLCSL
jgi:hypothetical protein